MPKFILALDSHISGKHRNRIQEADVVISQPFVMDKQSSAERL